MADNTAVVVAKAVFIGGATSFAVALVRQSPMMFLTAICFFLIALVLLALYLVYVMAGVPGARTRRPPG